MVLYVMCAGRMTIVVHSEKFQESVRHTAKAVTCKSLLDRTGASLTMCVDTHQGSERRSFVFFCHNSTMRIDNYIYSIN